MMSKENIEDYVQPTYEFINNITELDNTVVIGIKERVDKIVTEKWLVSDVTPMISTERGAIMPTISDLFKRNDEILTRDGLNGPLGRGLPSYTALQYVERMSRVYPKYETRKFKKAFRKALMDYHRFMLGYVLRVVDETFNIGQLTEFHEAILMGYDSTIIDGAFDIRPLNSSLWMKEKPAKYYLLETNKKYIDKMNDGTLIDMLNNINDAKNRMLLVNILYIKVGLDTTLLKENGTYDFTIDTIKHEITRAIVYSLEYILRWNSTIKISICKDCNELYSSAIDYDKCKCPDCIGLTRAVLVNDGTIYSLKNSNI